MDDHLQQFRKGSFAHFSPPLSHWVPQEADSEMMILVQDFYEWELTESTLEEGGGEKSSRQKHPGAVVFREVH